MGFLTHVYLKISYVISIDISFSVNIIWPVALRFINTMESNYCLVHTPRGSYCLSISLILDCRKTIHYINLLTNSYAAAAREVQYSLCANFSKTARFCK